MKAAERTAPGNVMWVWAECTCTSCSEVGLVLLLADENKHRTQVPTLRYQGDAVKRSPLLAASIPAAPPMAYLDLRQLEAHPIAGAAIRVRVAARPRHCLTSRPGMCRKHLFAASWIGQGFRCSYVLGAVQQLLRCIWAPRPCGCGCSVTRGTTPRSVQKCLLVRGSYTACHGFAGAGSQRRGAAVCSAGG